MSRAVSWQCKCVAKAEAGSPGEAGCKLSRRNGSSSSAVMLGPGLRLPAASNCTPAIYSITFNPSRGWPYMWCVGFRGRLCSWRLGGRKGTLGREPFVSVAASQAQCQRIQD